MERGLKAARLFLSMRVFQVGRILGYLMGVICMASCSTEQEESRNVSFNESPQEVTSVAPAKKSDKFFGLPELIASVWSSDNDSLSSENLAEPDSLIHQNTVEFTSKAGDRYQILFKCFARSGPMKVAEIVSASECNFKIDEKTVLNTFVTITAIKNNRIFFEREISKKEFNKILDKRFLKTHQLVGADLFTFNEKLKQFIFRINLARQIGGTEWFAQVYYVVNEAGKIVTKGLCDYPFHCQDIMSLSADGQYLLTCSEIINLKNPVRKSFRNKSVVLSKFINDSLFTLVYDTRRDSVVCDTVIYWNEDTLAYRHKIPVRDSLFNNAYIVHVKGDTLANFAFKGFSAGTDGYYSNYSPLSKMNMVGYYDKIKRTLQVFELDNGMKQRVYPLHKLDYIALSPNYDSFFEFNTLNDKGKSAKLRFFVNSNRKIVGYTFI